MVVFLNADVILAPDYLRRIQSHYEAGADYLVLRSVVANQDCTLGLYLEAQKEGHAPSDAEYYWSEGFFLQSLGGEGSRRLFPATSPSFLQGLEIGVRDVP